MPAKTVFRKQITTFHRTWLEKYYFELQGGVGMSFEAITTIRDAENRAKQIQADAQAAAAAAVEAARAEGKAAIEAAVGKAQRELQTLRAKSDEKAKADAEKLAAETKNKEAAMRIKAKTNLDRAASLIVERIVNG